MSGKGRRGTRICSHITDSSVSTATSVRASISSPNTCQYIHACKKTGDLPPFCFALTRSLTFYTFNIINFIFVSLPKCAVLFLETTIISSTSFKISTCDISIIVMINKDSLSFGPLFQLSAYVQRSRDIISASSCYCSVNASIRDRFVMRAVHILLKSTESEFPHLAINLNWQSE